MDRDWREKVGHAKIICKERTKNLERPRQEGGFFILLTLEVAFFVWYT